MADYLFIGENIELLQKRIQTASIRANRNPEDISFLAVSKFHPLEAVKEAYRHGIRRFGENRVQEAVGKFTPEVRTEMPGITLDMLGTLQGNKIGKALEAFDSIQSVSSLALLEGIAKRLGLREKILDIYLELHTGEASKSGFPSTESLFEAVGTYVSLKERERGANGVPCPMRLVGLMTMAPFTDDEELIRASFRRLSGAAEQLRERFDLPGFDQLSMGMSDDFEIAVEEGATLLRIGTAIFGARS